MNRLTGIGVVLFAAFLAQADTLTLSDGREVKGRLAGFNNHQFEFMPLDGTPIMEFPLKIKSIIADTPIRVDMDTILNTYRAVNFVSFQEKVVHFSAGGENNTEPVIMLKRIMVTPPPAPPQPPPETVVPQARVSPVGDPRGISPSGAAPRDWVRSGKWKEMEARDTYLISKGEEVDIESFLKKGYVNIVHFHYPKAVASIREGNYIETLVAKRGNRTVIQRIQCPDFNAPICVALGIKSLPQFWFYDSQGNLVTKLTSRFTEGDIDEALKQARRGGR
ncbi:MAG: hypothetical protein WCO42_01190 [bacterium]